MFVESETVKLKSELVSDVCKEIAAFANSHGGTLYIGIRKETDSDSFEEMRSLEQKLAFSTAEKIFQERGVAFDRPRMQTMGLLSVDGIYSNLSLLLSDQCPSMIKTATFSGTDQTIFQDR